VQQNMGSYYRGSTVGSPNSSHSIGVTAAVLTRICSRLAYLSSASALFQVALESMPSSYKLSGCQHWLEPKEPSYGMRPSNRKYSAKQTSNLFWHVWRWKWNSPLRAGFRSMTAHILRCLGFRKETNKTH